MNKPHCAHPAYRACAASRCPYMGRTETVTRTELVNHIAAAFTAGPATRDTMLAYAVSSHARTELIAVVQGLPDKGVPQRG